jgi:hypothetical protein
MKSLPNIEKSGFRRGEYVGYANGAWRIYKAGREWCAQHPRWDRPRLRASTLTDISRLLEKESAK